TSSTRGASPTFARPTAGPRAGCSSKPRRRRDRSSRAPGYWPRSARSTTSTTSRCWRRPGRRRSDRRRATSSSGCTTASSSGRTALAAASAATATSITSGKREAARVTTFLSFTVIGIAVGCVYAVAATGLVVTYTTSGIFNFAHGAIGMVMAFTYWELRVHHHWPTPLALLVVLGILAPLFGALIERVLIRPLHGSSTGVALVVTLGLLLTLLGAGYVIWDPSTPRVLPKFFGSNRLRLVAVNVSYHQLTIVAVALIVAALLRLLFYRTRVGIAMRAVVDDPDLAAMNAVEPARIAQLSWALGATLAALAGILVAPLVNLDALTLTLLIVDAFAAAM